MGLIGVVVASVAAVVGWFLVHQSSKKKTISTDTVVPAPLQELLEIERASNIHAPATTTITFYKGKNCESYVRSRVEEIVKANPWLDSRLLTIKERGGVCAVYNPSNPTRFSHFETVKGIEISRQMPYSKLAKAVKPFGVEMGRLCIDKDKSLFKVALIDMTSAQSSSEPGSSEPLFALVFSMSRALGDGHTFYQVNNMLDPKRSIRALQFERSQSFMNELLAIQGPNFPAWFKSPAALFGFVGTLLAGLLIREAHTAVFEIDEEQMKAKKTELLDASKNKMGFLSSNDIIAALFFKHSYDEFSLMLLNFRNRIKSLTDNMAGNYESYLPYDREEGTNPNAIRESVQALRTKGDFIPSAWQSFRSRCAVTSNWSTFYADVVLPGTVIDAHMPAMDPTETVLYDLVIIFTIAGKRQGVLYCGRSYTAEQFATTYAEILGGAVIASQ
jgi:hypothetical protein